MACILICGGLGISVAATEILHRISNEQYDAFDVNPRYVQVMTESKHKIINLQFIFHRTGRNLRTEH